MGRYVFPPGSELQLDTSSHKGQLGGMRRKAQTVSAVLRYSCMLFFRLYPNFKRFDRKVLLDEAQGYVESDSIGKAVRRGFRFRVAEPCCLSESLMNLRTTIPVMFTTREMRAACAAWHVAYGRCAFCAPTTPESQPQTTLT